MTVTLSSTAIANLRQRVWKFYRTHERPFPFRETTDPYKITVSEIMLQQTQAERVVEHYLRWVERWPNWTALSRATNRELLSAWSGLGYNRRALWLGQIAKTVCAEFAGFLPRDLNELKRLPGIGEYTSRAIMIFAHNAQLATVDTNIRQALIAGLSLDTNTSNRELLSIAEQLVPRGKSREWNYALMDYARLGLSTQAKRLIPKPRQSSFRGSSRQIRGEIVRRLTLSKSVGLPAIEKALGRSQKDVERAARSLEREGMIKVRNGRVVLLG